MAHEFRFIDAGHTLRVIAALVVLSTAVASGGIALAQGDSAVAERDEAPPRQDSPEEVIVRGRRLTDLRFEVEQARERAYGIFNEINSDDDFDVYCRDEARTGTRSVQRVCRAQFERRISARAAQEYMAALSWRCDGPADQSQECMFSDGAASAAASAAQGVEGEALGKRAQMNEEILRLARQNERFARAVLDFYEASQQYQAARKRRRD